MMPFFKWYLPTYARALSGTCFQQLAQIWRGKASMKAGKSSVRGEICDKNLEYKVVQKHWHFINKGLWCHTWTFYIQKCIFLNAQSFQSVHYIQHEPSPSIHTQLWKEGPLRGESQPNVTDLWQVGNSFEQKGSFKMAMKQAKKENL